MPLGRTEPRLWTPPLRELTPETSVGFDQVEFAAEVVRRPFDPWQEFAVIHAGELLPDGRPRFRIVLILVSRQNGKTEIPVVLSAYWQFVDAWPLILGTSTKLDYARESWHKAVKLIEGCADPGITELRPNRWKREANGEQESWTLEGSRYKIAASNAEGGRSLTINRLVCDELRQHYDYSAWSAAEPAASPYDAQIWCLSNAGDDRSVVLNELRDDAIRYIETGQGDPRLGIFEWSAPEDADPTDLDMLAMANPNMGRRLDPEVLLADARRAVQRGGESLAAFKTEKMCIRVPMLDSAIDATAWSKPRAEGGCLDPGDLADVRSRVALCFDVAMDEQHATLTAAAVLPDDRVRVEPVAAWSGPDAVSRMLADLPGKAAEIRPRLVGWLPDGPSAAAASRLAKRVGWPPHGAELVEIRGEVTAVCMGFSEQVKSGQVAHSDDPLQNAHVTGAEKARQGDRWRFMRRGAGHCDAAYAGAGAVHLARTLPPPVGKPRIVVAGDSS